MKRIITIDGPSGAGKSTVAKELARRLGFQYLDTGALYRAAALYLRNRGFDETIDDQRLRAELSGADIFFNGGRVFLNGKDVSEAIRTPEIGHYSSVFSARPVVREFLLGLQRSFPERHNTVAEGRDMGTVVFPEADCKFFLDASVKERARRRFLQLRAMGKEITEEEAFKDVVERDRRDSSRDVSPLKKADDALYVDTSELSLEDTIELLYRYITEKCGVSA
ncbi:MAG: (d)CMP kinase [Nitrospirae bacterium]|nr:MAG: (d)CMP kinase [Nitrospirota bacterium]